MYQWADICNGWWGGRKTLSSIRLRRGTSERYPEFVFFFLYFKKYFGNIYLRSQANSVFQSWEFTGKSNRSSTAGVFAKWRMEIGEERSDKEQRHWRRPERCVWNHRTMTSDIWGLNVRRVCQLLLDAGLRYNETPRVWHVLTLLEMRFAHELLARRGDQAAGASIAWFLSGCECRHVQSSGLAADKCPVAKKRNIRETLKEIWEEVCLCNLAALGHTPGKLT